ncbi:hypothetical protein WMY93_015873 [Mugilogobius chulae]|uniref:Uncharacterized protein n=1 Tax=Mugilogobius chulae TaxID=88201 RepID=A0AAW0P1N0_9GOBI
MSVGALTHDQSGAESLPRLARTFKDEQASMCEQQTDVRGQKDSPEDLENGLPGRLHLTYFLEFTALWINAANKG